MDPTQTTIHAVITAYIQSGGNPNNVQQTLYSTLFPDTQSIVQFLSFFFVSIANFFWTLFEFSVMVFVIGFSILFLFVPIAFIVDWLLSMVLNWTRIRFSRR